MKIWEEAEIVKRGYESIAEELAGAKYHLSQSPQDEFLKKQIEELSILERIAAERLTAIECKLIY